MTDETPEEKIEPAVTEPVAEEPMAEVPVAEEPAPEEPKPAPSKLVNFDELRAGQTVRLHERIIDISPKGEERQRVQVFEGIILGLRGAGPSRTLTIRKMSGTVGVEKIYPINSPVIDKIELVKTARVRRAKLNFITDLKKRFKRKFKETYISKS